MDKRYDVLNEFLDSCINDALQETTDKFQVGIDHTREVDYEQYADRSDRFKGFKEDKNDPEGEKMKDYERRPPFKIYQRPLSAEETRNYKQYEEDMGTMTPSKPGTDRPSWKGFDESVQGYDKTEEYSKYMKPRSGTKREEFMPKSEDYSQSELKPDQVREMYKSSKKSEIYQQPRQFDFHKNNLNNQQDSATYHNVTKPQINPNLYQPLKQEEKRNEERWTYKPKFTNSVKPESMYKDTMNREAETTRRNSEPAMSYKPEFTSPSDIWSEGKFQTFENFYKNVAMSDLKPDYYKENNKYEPPQDGQIEHRAEEKQKEKMKPGMNSEEVKEELLKLRPAIMERATWGALPPMGKVTPMKPPADTIVFTLNTGTPHCHTEDECRRTVREIQARHMGRGLADIQYNFLVGGDGNMYEGRGWAYESGIKPEKQQGKNYNIAFIGDYQNDIEQIPPHMLGPVQELIVWGNAIRLMTKATKSAGEYKVQNKIENDVPTP